jgi:cell fate regulator YaaT (PSP1 superfamily)
MARLHTVRLGTWANIGRFVAADAVRYPRHSRVVLRTARGLELGEVLAPPHDETPGEADGEIVRTMTIEDELLAARLEQRRSEAMLACQSRLEALGLRAAPLVDVEPLFDGQTLVFYFLGEPAVELVTLTEELAEVYESQAKIRGFADALTNGCGPDCGTHEAEGTGCASCATGCAVASACAVRR